MWQCRQHIRNIYIQYCLELFSTVYWLCCLYMRSFSQYDIFSQLLHNWLCNNVYSISATYTYCNVYNYTTLYTGFAVYICFPFHNMIFSTHYWQLSIWQCLQHIRNIYIQYCLQLQYPVDWLCCLYMLPLHNVIFFHNYCTIDSTTIFPAYPQHIPTVLFTITLTSILTLLFIYASFTQCDIFSQLLHNWLCNNVYSIFATYTYGNVYNHTSVHWLCCLYMLSFSQYDIFHTLLYNCLYDNVYSIFATYTYSTVYNYSTQ